MPRWLVANLVGEVVPIPNMIACYALSWSDTRRLLFLMHVCSLIGKTEYNRFSAANRAYEKCYLKVQRVGEVYDRLVFV